MTQMICLTSFPLVVSVLYFLFSILRLWRKRQQIKSEHGCQRPPNYPHTKQSKLLERWTIRFEQYGDTFAEILLGAPMIATIDPLNVQTMLGSNFKGFGVQPLRRSTTLSFLGEGVFTMFHFNVEIFIASLDSATRFVGPCAFTKSSHCLYLWRIFFQKLSMTLNDRMHSRTLMRTTFTRTNVANLPAIEKNTQKFFKLLPGDGSTVDLKPLNFSTLSTTLGKLAFLYRDKKYYDSIKVAHAFADFYVDKAIKYHTDGLSKEEPTEKDRSGHKYVLLHDMAMQTDNRNELGSQILHRYHHRECTTPTLLKPKRVGKDSSRAHGTSISRFTHDDLRKSKYLQNVIKERWGSSERWRPDGKSPIFIRKGTAIITPLYNPHRLADCFQLDGDKFIPSRWEDPSLRPGAAYIPFGWGIRTFPAQHLAEIEIAYILARMAQKWKYLECRDEVEEWVEELRVSTSSRNGVKVALIAE
ncbi:hypothetical protein BELL_0426g00050 [Botrytis elliptica]|uniref:Cytochrome P450 n=1 Tax=Botrytis elliptica TaxID=278938 RepID=A0A4Z1JTZ8_9HELO|nr:hypothetical protein BELL_0426g00050 [Botrytis elliptica]